MMESISASNGEVTLAITIDQIEGMSDSEWARLSKAGKAEVMAVILESLCADGLAYQGADGRYRMREDVVWQGDGNASASRPN